MTSPPSSKRETVKLRPILMHIHQRWSVVYIYITIYWYVYIYIPTYIIKKNHFEKHLSK